ncbi:ABC transporter permease [Methylobacterium dankookense]|uniref:Aliphatic sulfonates transport permease protein SsuC n=1 Tax=Methylobacterium dankookense TaxID=560405 RepID=A0A564G3W4_9HYPH|nr:ABC transporter permease [Methylobacterium dankookense]GJD54808.1 Putative aliphatic sulfonates transport permease protein SsuC [Methylobacterium dankookense]VUF14281.1 Putative aliphatic sulfonates transport permease protein SsuC [Methylobacterium dankookense]
MSAATLEAPGAALAPPKAESRRAQGRLPLRRLVTRAAALGLGLLAWHLAASQKLDLGLVTFRNVPTPADVARAAWALAHSPKLGAHVGASLARVLGGFMAALVAGIGLGLAIGRSRLAGDLLLPPLEVLRPIPAVAWIPLAILIFPSSEASMVFITFTGALFPILLNTVHEAEAASPRLVASARSLGAGRAAILREVVIPAALPSIVTGAAIGMGTAWFCLVTAEMISGQYGIGYFTWESYTLQNYDDIVVGMLLIGLLGMGSSVAVRAAGRLAMPWTRAGGRS